MKKLLLISSLFVLGCGIASAQTLPSLQISSDAATLGVASSTIASAAGAFSVDRNISAIVLGENKLFAGASYGKWQPDFADDTYLAAGAAMKLNDKLGFGLSFKLLNQQPYNVTAPSSSISGEYTPSEMTAALGVAYALTDFLSVGVSARYTSSNLAKDSKAGVIGADLAASFKTGGLSAAVAVNNLGGKVNYGKKEYDQPTMVRAGAAYSLGSKDASMVTASLEAAYLLSGGIMGGIGAEYAWNNMVFLRCGYHYGNDVKLIPSFASVGLGIKFFGIGLDAAYLLASDTLGNSLLATLSFSF